MAKRARDDNDDDDDAAAAAFDSRTSKRVKPSPIDRLSNLSDELILRVLAYLPVSQLAVCHRLSHKYQGLAADGQLWKSQYYNRFVRPRASRLPGIKDASAPNQTLYFASKASKWLDDEYLLKRGGSTNWKRQYKLRHNWSLGSCAVNEIPVAEQAAVPPILVQMHDGIIYTADQTDGLRTWSAKGEQRMIARIPFILNGKAVSSSSYMSPPTSLAIDSTGEKERSIKIIVGFEDGSFRIYACTHDPPTLTCQFVNQSPSNGVLSAVAISWPYVLTMTATQQLSLYHFHPVASGTSDEEISKSPKLLHSLKSHSVWPPLSLSLRISASNILICIAYALPTYLSGWTVGIQEVRLSLEGEMLGSRTASAIEQHYRPLAFSSRPIFSHLVPSLAGSLSTATTLEMRHIHSKPTSLSYTHPYLLVSHPDNTLTLYLVTSTAESLTISPGSRLWGHTSAVSGVQVGGRGKAVSVSRRGDELRVWELEGGFASSAARKRLATGDLSVQIKPENITKGPSDGLPQSGLDFVSSATSLRLSPNRSALEAEHDDASELTLTRGWIGFDEENVVVLKEQSQGKQALVVYDFT